MVVDWLSMRAAFYSDEGVKFWDLNGECFCTLVTLLDDTVAIDWLSMRALIPHNVQSTDYAIQLWNLENSTCIRTLEGLHKDCVKSIVADWRTMRALSTSEDGTLKLWSLDSGECLHSLNVQGDAENYQVNV